MTCADALFITDVYHRTKQSFILEGNECNKRGEKIPVAL